MSPADPGAPAPQYLPSSWNDDRLRLTERIKAVGDGSPAIEKALWYAALSARFAPDDALASAGLPAPAPLSDGGTPSLDRLAAVARLADACDTRLWQPRWIMRAAPRERIIAAMAETLLPAIAWRRAAPSFDAAASEICDALLGKGDFSPAAVETLLADGNLSAEHCRTLIRGVSLAMPLAPARSHLTSLRTALAKIEASGDPEFELIDHGFVGREAELDTIEASLAKQWRATAGRTRQVGMLYIGGIGGMGKSTLLAEARHRYREMAIIVALDFDRPGIDGGNQLGLTIELCRQVADALGSAGGPLVEAIQQAASGVRSRQGAFFRNASRLLGLLEDLLGEPRRRVLITLDTLESLTLHGDAAARELTSWINLLKQRLRRVAFLAAGRERMPSAFRDIADTLALSGLSEEESEAMLERLGAPRFAWEDLIRIAAGNALLLRLGAKVAATGAVDLLADGNISESAEATLKASQLYRLILSRIGSPRLRAIAHPGLLLRQVNARLIVDVIAPEVGMDDMDMDGAKALIDELEQQAWLVERSGEWLLHRPEMRPFLLDLQIADNQPRARRLFAAAQRWHRRYGDKLLALYYRLQAMRWDRRTPSLDRDLVYRFTSAMLDELPLAARNAVALARGERTQELRDEGIDLESEGRPLQGSKMPTYLHSGIAEELRMLLARQDYAEAASMVERMGGDIEVEDPSDGDTAVLIEALWRAGEWTKAHSILKRRLAFPPKGPDDLLIRLAPVHADLDPTGFRKLIRDEPDWGREIFDHAEGLKGENASTWDTVLLLCAAEDVGCPSGFAGTLWATWTGASLPAEDRAKEYVQFSSDRLGRLDARGDDVSLRSLIELLLPDQAHADILRHRLQRLSDRRLDIVSILATATLNAWRTNEAAASIEEGSAFLAIEQVNGEGALAPFLTALALQQPGWRLKSLAEAVRRRMATAAGYWSFGELPRGWRQPVTDWRTMLDLAAYSRQVEKAESEARDELQRWLSGHGGGAGLRLQPMLKRAEALAESTPLPIFGAGLPRIAQMFIDAGMPLALAPIHAVLAHRRLPIEARTSLTWSPLQ